VLTYSHFHFSAEGRGPLFFSFLRTRTHTHTHPLPMPPKKPGAAGANQKKPLVVVAGATGHIGGEVVKDLAAHGYRVTALVRPGRPASMAAAHRLESLGAHVVFADPTQADTLEGVADGAEAVVSALGVRCVCFSMGGGERQVCVCGWWWWWWGAVHGPCLRASCWQRRTWPPCGRTVCLCGVAHSRCPPLHGRNRRGRPMWRWRRKKRRERQRRDGAPLLRGRAPGRRRQALPHRSVALAW